MHSNDRFSPLHTGLPATPISGFWELGLNQQDPEVPNLPLDNQMWDDDGTGSWFAGLMQPAMAAVAALALAASATAAQAQGVGSGWQTMDEVVPLQAANTLPPPVSMVVVDPPTAMPAPWYWHVDEIPSAPPAALTDDPALKFTQAPWQANAIPVWLYEAESRAPTAGDEGAYQPTAPKDELRVAWLSAPTGGYVADAPAATVPGDEGTPPVAPALPWPAVRPAITDDSDFLPPPATIAGDEGAFMVVPAVPDYVLLPPPSSGMSNDTTQVGSIQFEDTYDPVRLLFGVPKILPDPVLYVDASEAQVFTPSEDYWLQPAPMVWAIQILPPFQTDEYPNGVAPQLSEDAYFPPPPLPQPFALAWLSAPTGGYVADAPSTVAVEDDPFFPPLPPVWRPVIRPLWDEPLAYAPVPFFLTEDLDPEFLVRALPPVWKAVRTPFGLWEIQEARVTAATAGGASGAGRTHLLLGQIQDASAPSAAAAELYTLTNGYGMAVGTDTPLLIETPDIAPLGPQGRLRLRRIAVPIQYDAACTIRITPIVDYGTELAPLVVTHEAPGEVTRHLIQAKYLTACTVVRLRIEVVSRAGLVEIYRPSVFFSPLSGGTTMALGGAP